MNKSGALVNMNTVSVFLIAFSAGIYFAVLQFAYYFLLEAYVTSRSVSFFIALFFWLVGFLLGLNYRGKKLSTWIPVFSITGYYLFYSINLLFPFKNFTFIFLAVCIVVSGMYPGAFFKKYSSMYDRIKNFFFTENNGFIIGVVLSYFGSVFAGNLFIKYLPFVTFCFIMIIQTVFKTAVSYGANKK